MKTNEVMTFIDFGTENTEVSFTFDNPLREAGKCNAQKKGTECRLSALQKVPHRVSVKDLMRQQGIDPEQRRKENIKKAKELAELEARMTPEQLNEVRRLQQEEHERKMKEVERERKKLEKQKKKEEKERNKQANRLLADDEEYMSAMSPEKQKALRELKAKQLAEDAEEAKAAEAKKAKKAKAAGAKKAKAEGKAKRKAKGKPKQTQKGGAVKDEV